MWMSHSSPLAPDTTQRRQPPKETTGLGSQSPVLQPCPTASSCLPRPLQPCSLGLLSAPLPLSGWMEPLLSPLGFCGEGRRTRPAGLDGHEAQIPHLGAGTELLSPSPSYRHQAAACLQTVSSRLPFLIANFLFFFPCLTSASLLPSRATTSWPVPGGPLGVIYSLPLCSHLFSVCEICYRAAFLFSRENSSHPLICPHRSPFAALPPLLLSGNRATGCSGSQKLLPVP